MPYSSCSASRPPTSARITVTRIRERNGLTRAPGRQPRGSCEIPCAEAAAAGGVLVDGRAEVVGVEVGPERVGEHELGVRGLPEEEVREPQLARRPHEQVDLAELGAVEPTGERALVDVSGGDAFLHELPR